MRKKILIIIIIKTKIYIKIKMDKNSITCTIKKPSIKRKMRGTHPPFLSVENKSWPHDQSCISSHSLQSFLFCNQIYCGSLFPMRNHLHKAISTEHITNFTPLTAGHVLWFLWGCADIHPFSNGVSHCNMLLSNKLHQPSIWNRYQLGPKSWGLALVMFA